MTSRRRTFNPGAYLGSSGVVVGETPGYERVVSAPNRSMRSTTPHASMMLRSPRRDAGRYRSKRMTTGLVMLSGFLLTILAGCGMVVGAASLLIGKIHRKG